MYAAPVRRPVSAASTHSTSAAMIQGSQMSYPPHENASQMPRTIVPVAPIPMLALPTFTTGPMRIVPSGVSVRAYRDDQDPEQDDTRDVRERAQDVEREEPVVETHARPILGQ